MAKNQPTNAAKRESPAKPQKPPKKGGRKRQPLNREERRKAAWLRKTERKVAKQTLTEVGTKASAGLTYAQLEASGLARQSRPAGPTFEQTLLKVVAEQARQFESAAEVTPLPDTFQPEVRIIIGGEIFSLADYVGSEESLSSLATRKAVEAEIRSLLALLEKTEPVFKAFYRLDIPALQLAIGEAFEKEPEDSPLRLRFAEVILADDLAKATGDFMEEVYDRIQELQIVASSLDPENELEKSARLELIDGETVERIRQAAAKETCRLELARQLSAAPSETSPVLAELIEEAKKAAEVQRRKRVAFRRELSNKLRQRKEREGRRFSKSPEESGDEELIRFLISHRGDLASMWDFIPPHIREQVETLLEEEKRKGPLKREIAAASDAARRRWDELKSRLAAGAADPETAVAQNAAAMRSLLGILAQTKALHQRLAEPSQPQPVAVNVVEKLYRDKSWRGNATLALALKAALA
jgi:hypothetical protein